MRKTIPKNIASSSTQNRCETIQLANRRREGALQFPTARTHAHSCLVAPPQLSAWMDGLQKQLSAPPCISPADTVEALQTLISQQQQQQANTQVYTHTHTQTLTPAQRSNPTQLY